MLKARVALLGEAFRNEQFEVVIDMMHPSAFATGVTKEDFLAMTKKASVQMKEVNFAILNEQLGTPGEVNFAGDELVAFYPRTMVMQMGAKKYRHTGFVICVKKRAGGEWLFIDGEAVSKDLSSLGRFLPDLPKDLKLPETKVEEIE